MTQKEVLLFPRGLGVRLVLFPTEDQGRLVLFGIAMRQVVNTLESIEPVSK